MWSSPSSSSCSERIIPSDTEPRSVACSSTRPSGKHRRRAARRRPSRRRRSSTPRTRSGAGSALPHVHRAQLEPVGVRVLAGLEHAPDAVETEVAVRVGDAVRLDPLHLAAREQQPFARARRPARRRRRSRAARRAGPSVRTASARGGRSPRTCGCRGCRGAARRCDRARGPTRSRSTRPGRSRRS